MKETRLGEFEEVLLLLVGILREQAYALRIAESFAEETGRKVSIGAVHSTLKRLEDKGFLSSRVGEASATRGGRRKRLYEVSGSGEAALSASRSLKQNLWARYPSFD